MRESNTGIPGSPFHDSASRFDSTTVGQYYGQRLKDRLERTGPSLLPAGLVREQHGL